MNAKYLAFICVCVLSSEIASATFFWPKPHKENGGGKKDGHCSCNSGIKKTIESKFVSIKSSLEESFKLQEDTVGEYSFREGSIQNMHKFKIENYGCSVGRNFLRILVYVKFDQIRLNYRCWFLENVHKTIFGSIISGLFSLLGRCVGLLLSIKVESRIVVVLRQEGFNENSRLFVESIDYDSFNNLKVESSKVKNHEEVGKHVQPCVSRGIKQVIEKHFKQHVTKRCSEVIVRKTDVQYTEEYEESTYESTYERREDDSGDSEHAYVSEKSNKKDDSYKKGKSYESKDRYETDGTYVKDDSYEKGDTYEKDKSRERDDSYEKDGDYERDESYKKDRSNESGKSYEKKDSYRYED